MSVCNYMPYQAIYDALKGLVDAATQPEANRWAALNVAKEALALVEQEVAKRNAYAGEIEAAREMYANDDCEIDDLPMLSEADSGVWVSAWLWVNTQEDES